MAISSVQEYFGNLQERFVSEAAEGVSGNIQWQLSGDGGGDYWAELANGAITLHDGVHDAPDVTFVTSADTYVKIVNGEMNGAAALLTRKLQMSGSFALARKLATILPNDG